MAKQGGCHNVDFVQETRQNYENGSDFVPDSSIDKLASGDRGKRAQNQICSGSPEIYSDTNSDGDTKHIEPGHKAEQCESLADQSGAIRPFQSPPNRSNNPLFLLINKLKKSRAPPKEPWQHTEVLENAKCVEITVVHISKDLPFFYGNFVDKQHIALDIMSRANDLQSEHKTMRTIEVGSICLVEVATVIYRGVVESTSPYSVRLLDFGYTVIAAEQNIFIAPEFFHSHPAQAICMTLAPGQNIELQEFGNVFVKFTGKMSGAVFVVEVYNNENDQNPSVIREVQRPDINLSQEKLDTSLESKNVETNENVTLVEELSTDCTKSPELHGVNTKVDNMYLVDTEEDIMISNNSETNTDTLSELNVKPKNHALDYLHQGMSGRLIIQERPCSNKFSLNLNTPEIESLREKLALDMHQFTNDEMVTNPEVGDEVVVKVNGDLLRAKVLISRDHLTYVALTDVGKVVPVNELYLLKNPTDKKYPALSIIGTVLSINIENNIFESYVEKYTALNFKVESVDETVKIKCRFEGMSEVCCSMELSSWEPTWEQLSHGRIYEPELSNGSVFIMHFDGENVIYVRDSTPEADNIYKRNLVEIYRYSDTAKPFMMKPVLNEIVLARYKWKGFHLGIVKGINGNNMTIHYLAFGITEIVGLDDLREPSDKIKCLKLFVRKVILADVPLGPWTHEVVNLLSNKNIVEKDHADAIEFQMILDKETNKVHLRYPDGRSLNEELSHLLTPEWHKLKKLPLEKMEEVLRKAKVFMMDDIQLHELPIGDADLYITDVSNLISNVFFATTYSFNTMVVVIQELRKALAEYAERINYPYNPRVNELCIAKFDEGCDTEIWLRGHCLCQENNEYCIVSLDLGLQQYVSSKNIRRITKDFLEPPALSALCSLEGIPENLESQILGHLSKELKPYESKVKFTNIVLCSDGYTMELTQQHMEAVVASTASK